MLLLTNSSDGTLLHYIVIANLTFTSSCDGTRSTSDMVDKLLTTRSVSRIKAMTLARASAMMLDRSANDQAVAKLQRKMMKRGELGTRDGGGDRFRTWKVGSGRMGEKFNSLAAMYCARLMWDLNTAPCLKI